MSASNSFFKTKTTKKTNIDEKTTLDVFHQFHVRKIQNEKEQATDLKKEIEELNDLIFESNDDLERGQMEKRRDDLLKQVREMENEDRIYDYFLDTGDILFQYYEVQDAISRGDTNGMKSAPKRKPGDILSVLEEAAKRENTVVETTPKYYGKKTLGRNDLLDKYLQKIDPTHTQKIADMDNLGECFDCGEDMIFASNEAMLYCNHCGNTEFILIDSDRPSYKDPPRESSYYAYKRINHFNELLAQYQAKESTEIPEEIFEQILEELKKQRITNETQMKNLKPQKLREVLKKLKLNRLYDHIPHIINRLNRQNAPVMDRDTEEKLRHMFKEIQPSFQNHCPKNRRNFLSYSYVLYKFCELLELDDFLKSFPLLKNRDKLYAQDKVWELICKDMKWEFIRSI
jgi:hypothetical protein